MTSEWGEDKAASIAHAVASDWDGVDSAKIELVRLGTNAVFLADQGVIRVSPPDYPKESLAQQIALAKWLVKSGFPTAEPLTSQVRQMDGCYITLWRRLIPAPGASCSAGEIGRLARLFHSLTESYEGDLPGWDPVGRLGIRLSHLRPDDLLSESDIALIKSRHEHLIAPASHLESRLGWGPIHGDIHPGNVLVNEAGEHHLLDFDRIARGPREWDLTQPVVSQLFFGRDVGHVDQFMVGYGTDPREFDGFDVLVQLRALFMTSWLLTLPRTERVAKEIRTRLAYWRDPSATLARWSPV